MAVDAEGFIVDLPPIPETEFAVHGTVHAHPAHADSLDAFYAETTRLAQSEPGIIFYTIGRDPDDPNIFHFFERYTGKEAFDEHNAQPIIRKLFAEYKYIRGVKAKFVIPIAPAQSGGPYDLTKS